MLNDHLQYVSHRFPCLAQILLCRRNKSTPLTLIVNLDVPDEVILARISDRYVHLPSGRVYNMSYNKPKVPGYDDITGEPLTKRPDDNPVSRSTPLTIIHCSSTFSQETFALRLKKFYQATSPLLDYYASKPSTGTKLITLKGSTSDDIWPELDAIIRQAFPGLPERTEPKKKHSLADAIISGEERQKRTDPTLPVL